MTLRSERLTWQGLQERGELNAMPSKVVREVGLRLHLLAPTDEVVLTTAMNGDFGVGWWTVSKDKLHVDGYYGTSADVAQVRERVQALARKLGAP